MYIIPLLFLFSCFPVVISQYMSDKNIPTTYKLWLSPRSALNGCQQAGGQWQKLLSAGSANIRIYWRRFYGVSGHLALYSCYIKMVRIRQYFHFTLLQSYHTISIKRYVLKWKDHTVFIRHIHMVWISQCQGVSYNASQELCCMECFENVGFSAIWNSWIHLIIWAIAFVYNIRSWHQPLQFLPP